MPKVKNLNFLKTVNEMSEKEVKEMMFSEGDIIGERYEIQSLIGAGGMGAVYLVKDKRLNNHQKALKMILGKLLESEKAKQRFCNEILISQMLNHGNILRVYDYGEHGFLMYYTMEYIEGKDLREWMKEKKDKEENAKWEEIACIAMQILDGLEAAHEQTVHRDIKPENILLTKKGNGWLVKICDFGLAQVRLEDTKLSLSVGIMGTYDYMAPEQRRDSRKVDKRADLYSVGAIVYEALTGKAPSGFLKLPSKIREDIGKEIDDILVKALEEAPEERYQSAQEMKEAIEAEIKQKERGSVLSRQEEERRQRNSQAELIRYNEARTKREDEAKAKKEEPKESSKDLALEKTKPVPLQEEKKGKKKILKKACLVIALIGLLVGLGFLCDDIYQEPRASNVEAIIKEQRQAAKKTYQVLSSGIIQDAKTGLQWLVGPDKNTSWYEAKDWVENIDTSQYGSGWRMPTRKELPTIYEPGKGNCNIDPVFVSPRDYLYVWSEKTYSSLSAWYFAFHYGSEYWRYRSISYDSRVFAVRAGRQ